MAPANFSNPDGLRRSLEGADVLYNTYWVRFARGQTTFDRAVANSEALFTAAAQAGVGKIVHFSVTNAASDSRLPYFKGKGQVEEALRRVGVPHAILRPTLVFGEGDILVNNIAWALRRFPVFPVYGGGDFPVQPVYVGDLAEQAVAAGSQSGSSVADAAGPDTMSFEALLRLLIAALGVRRRLLHTPPTVGLALTALVGLLMRDVVLTRDEISGLMAGLLTSDAPPTGTTNLSSWLDRNADGLGRRYVSELGRNWRPFGR
ncbi:MAG: NmrA family NAD(P)-binding protein [Chloroflexi bacterium]|nr:NmrA family NAD(P)-binding protein [Chloroflexota bacterium]